MAMRSSIFNFEIIQQVIDSPRPRKAWLLVLLLSAMLLAVGYSSLLSSVFEDPHLRAKNPKILFIGTSHQMNAIDSSGLGVAVHKLDVAGLNLWLAERTFQKHRHRWLGIETALIEVDEFSLFTDLVGARIEDLSGLCGSLDLQAWQMIASSDDHWRRYRILANLWYGRGTPALDSDRRFTSERLFRLPVVEDSKSPHITASAGAQRVAYARNKLFLNAEEENLTTRNLPALRSLVDNLQRAGVRILLISYPLTAEYRAARPQHWQSQIQKAMQELIMQYPQIEYLNYSADPNFNKSHFKNADHLNKSGAKKLTQKIHHHLTKTARQ